MPKAQKKAGTVPVRRTPAGVWQVLLVSSAADGDSFVLPKGAVERNEKAREAAVRETLEEAGVLGRLGASKLCVVEYETPHGGLVSQKMWLLQVNHQLDDDDPLWKERARRERRWLSFGAARALVQGADRARPEVVSVLDAARAALESGEMQKPGDTEDE